VKLKVFFSAACLYNHQDFTRVRCPSASLPCDNLVQVVHIHARASVSERAPAVRRLQLRFNCRTTTAVPHHSLRWALSRRAAYDSFVRPL